MPRVRMLWPEHRSHRKVGALSDFDYRLWIGMIMEADDDGRVVADSAELRAKIWPYNGRVTVEQVKSGIRCLKTVGLIRVYTVKGLRYGWFPSWRNWQRPKYPTPSKLPAPPTFPQDSPRIPPGRGERSTPGGVELGGVELGGVGVGLGGEGSGEGNRRQGLSRSRSNEGDSARHVSEELRTVMERAGRKVLGAAADQS